jgi:hypothetical protein
MIEDDVLRIVLYFDVFGWPLARREVARFVRPWEPERVERACDALVASGRLDAEGAWIYAPGRGHHLEKRRHSGREAERRWPAARRAAAVLARFPHVRGVLVTGGLSKGAMGDDVDFLLLVAPGRVWITKTLLQAWRKALPEPVRECFCTNYLLAEDRLAIDDRNVYTAIELATAVPMYGGEACGRLLDANGWARSWVPGWDWAVQRAYNAPELPARRAAGVLEGAFALGGDGLERRALRLWDAYWNRKYAWLDDATRAQRFKRRPEVATNHLNDFQFWVLDEWAKRLRASGLEAA